MALAQIKSLSPDVVILDIQLPGQSGLEACREISKNFPNTKVVILTSYANQSFLQQAIRAGASGYVLKKVGSEELVRAIRAAHNGDNAFDAHTTSQMVARLKQLESQMEQSAFSS
jgi:DNA-binding NarL/FixJ family response regulator